MPSFSANMSPQDRWDVVNYIYAMRGETMSLPAAQADASAAPGAPAARSVLALLDSALEFANGGLATMIASFAATPARGARIAVMGERGTLIAEQPGPNPMEDGVVIGSRDGAPLAPLATPARYTPFTDARDHRLMAFRLLVREFNRGIDEGNSPAPSFEDGFRNQQVQDAVREASASGKTVRLR